MRYITIGFPILVLVVVVFNVLLLRKHDQEMQELERQLVVHQRLNFGHPKLIQAIQAHQLQQKQAYVVALENKPKYITNNGQQQSKPVTNDTQQLTASKHDVQKFHNTNNISSVSNNPDEDNKNRSRNNKSRNATQPRELSLAANATFSACLLIRDDNDILPEWLAYHYHVLGLRNLIIAVDPLSQEFPSDIASKWRIMTDLEILEWTDEDFMPQEFLKTKRPPHRFMQQKENFSDPAAHLEVSIHRYRQKVFLTECLRRFRNDGRSWVLHTDTDEFIVPSKLLRQMNPGYLSSIPTLDQPNAVLTLVQETVSKSSRLVNYPCLSLLRVLFGSVESTPEELQKDVPEPFSGDRFETLRWRYHAYPKSIKLNGNPKVLLDVSAIPASYFRKDEVVFSIHRPFRNLCRSNAVLSYNRFRQQPIGVNHYLGSWERYSGRNDKRRNREVYDTKASLQRGMDDGARLWLKGFCNTVGKDVAIALLGKAYVMANEDHFSGNKVHSSS
ncbi:hypothetical protein ACA910_005934 [Epithemia clementina (nom. ined.)]